MNEEFLIDVFRLCWDVILEEFVKNENGTYFNSEHCNILDTTDTNFDILENRLAYTYKYGCYNTLFFEKCVLNFLNECSDFEEVFPQKKLNVCSLSNGPGFDIIGLLCALCRSNRPLKSFPKLNAVNIFSSWLTLYKTLINKACKNINLKFTDYIRIKPENVSLFQGDILLSTLPLEAKKCISKSNVLLMVKTFFSSKATVNKFACSLRKIFLLLKPGTLIFFIGSKKDINNFSRRPFLSNYVKTIYGPQTVILENMMIDEKLSAVIGQKPIDSGHAEFVVWQKRNPTDMGALIKDFKENKISKYTKKKKSVSSNENIVDEADNCDYSSDSESKLSYTTSESSKLSYVLTSELKDYSYSNDFDSTSHGMKSKISSISPTLSENDNVYSIEEVISMLDKVYLDCVSYNEYKMDSSTQNQFQFCNDNASDFTNETERKFYGESLENSVSVINYPKGSTCVNSSITNLIENTTPQVLGNSAQESKDSLNLKCVLSASTNAKFPSDADCLSYENANESFYIKETRENGIIDQQHKMNDHFENSLNFQNDPKITFQENMSPFEQSCENIILQEENIVNPTTGNIKTVSENLCDKETPSLNSLVQQCENLVTALQKLTISLKNYTKGSKSYLKVNKHCFGQICKNSQLSHQCCCCVKIIPACCCKKICNC